MIISKILGFNFSPSVNNTQQNNNRTNFGLKMVSPLAHDTVSFGATKKNVTNEDKKEGVNLQTAMEIHDEALEMQPKVRIFANKIWGKYLVTDMNPRNPIEKICDRCKSPLSIREKSRGRHLNNKKEVFEKMTDLNGMKLVMRDANKKTVDKMLMELITPIKKGEVELIEIENKRPMVVKGKKGADLTKYDYASEDVLDLIAQTQNRKNNTIKRSIGKEVRVDMNDFTESNYTAIHMLLRLRGEKRPFELTLMGTDVNQFKDLDDKLFKIVNNKDVEDKYAPIKKLVKPLTEDGNQEQLEMFNKYRADAFLFQRTKAPSSYSLKKRPVHFLPLSDDLDPRLDLTELYKLMVRCDAKTEAESKKLQGK